MSSHQERAKIHRHPDGTRDAALRLISEGGRSHEIARELSVPVKTVQTWASKAGMRFKDESTRVLRRPRKGMSGVIAPAPFKRGYNWSGGW